MHAHKPYKNVHYMHYDCNKFTNNALNQKIQKASDLMDILSLNLMYTCWLQWVSDPDIDSIFL